MQRIVIGSLLVFVILCIVFAVYLSVHNFFYKVSPSVKNASRTVKIIKIVDGDTVITASGEKIRYIGINAPEFGQSFASEAANTNKDMVLGKYVVATFDQQKTDQYGRLLAYIHSNNLFVNEELVTKGLAISQSLSPNTLYQYAIEAAQSKAQKTCKGIWEYMCQEAKNSCLRIENIHFDVEGNDDTNKNDEWVQIKNSCVVPVDLTGWALRDSASHVYVFSTNVLRERSILTVHSGCGENTTADVYWKCPEQEHAVWNNSGDGAFLYDNKGRLFSVFRY